MFCLSGNCTEHGWWSSGQSVFSPATSVTRGARGSDVRRGQLPLTDRNILRQDIDPQLAPDA